MPKPAAARSPAVARKRSPPPGRVLAQPPARAGGEPLYKQLVQTLKQEILRGVFPVGSQLPTEDELSARFAVSRHTVREALRQLRADGLVASRQGSGTTVMPPPPSTPFNVHRVASIDELIAYAAESRYEVAQTDQVTSAQLAADDLPLPPDRRWLRLRGYRLSDEPGAAPVCWTQVFVAAEYAGVERMMSRQRGPIWRLIEDIYGERLVEVEQTLRVRPVPPELATGLQVDAEAAVVEVCRTYSTSAGQVAEVSVNLYPADKFRFTMKLRRA